MNNTIVANYFSHHPDTDIFYFTADGQAFYTENEADNHARNLLQLGKDAHIEAIRRENIPLHSDVNEKEQPDAQANGKDNTKKAGSRKK